MLISKTNFSAVSGYKFGSTSCAQVFMKYGILKTELCTAFLNDFHLDTKYRQCLAFYKLDYLGGGEFVGAMRKGTVWIKESRDSQPVEYSVVFKDCTRFKANQAARIRVSYRRAVKEYGLTAIAIVQIQGE